MMINDHVSVPCIISEEPGKINNSREKLTIYFLFSTL